MTDFYGDLVGSKVNTLQSTPLIPSALRGGQDHVLIRDRIALAASAAQNDRVLLAKLRSDTIINPVQSIIWFDDFGTSVTMDVGSTATENALVAAQDVATAAGSCSFLKSVDIANYWKPLWEQLGLASDPGGYIEIFAKFEAANPDAGDLAWQIVGQPR